MVKPPAAKVDKGLTNEHESGHPCDRRPGGSTSMLWVDVHRNWEEEGVPGRPESDFPPSWQDGYNSISNLI